MSENSDIKFKRHLALSFFVGAGLLLFSLFLGGGGHGNLLPLQFLFPIPVLLGYFSDLELFSFLLCLFQYPVYAIIILRARTKKTWILIPVLHISLCVLINFLNL